APAVHEVQLVLRVVVVVEAFVLRRVDDDVHAERRDAQRAPNLAEAGPVAELVDRSERVAHAEATIVIPPRAFCLSMTCTLSRGSSSASATSSRICTASASQNAPSVR